MGPACRAINDPESRTSHVFPRAERNFNEGAAQVRRLLDRDRRELMGEEDIGQSLKTEFDEEPGASSSDAGSIGSASNSTDSLAAATRTFPTGVRSALDAEHHHQMAMCFLRLLLSRLS